MFTAVAVAGMTQLPLAPWTWTAYSCPALNAVLRGPTVLSARVSMIRHGLMGTKLLGVGDAPANVITSPPPPTVTAMAAPTAA